jgi:uncharacterized YigZ family protein
MAKFTYFTAEKEGVSDFRDRGSKFFGYAFPIEDQSDCKQYLQQLKKQHPKASHFCLAWRLGPEGETSKSSDAGEPSGSAGKPIEGQILSREVTNVLVVVVRYFGGSLLGVPGLIHAYKTAAAMALDQAGKVEKKVELAVTIQFNYTAMNEVMMVVRDFFCRITKQEQGLFCTYVLAVPLEHGEKVKARLGEIRSVEIP